MVSIAAVATLTSHGDDERTMLDFSPFSRVLRLDFLQGKYREFSRFRPSWGRLAAKKSCPLGDFWRNSLLNGTGNYFGGIGNYLRRNRDSIRRAGKARGDSLNPEHGLAAFRERSPRRVSAPVPNPSPVPLSLAREYAPFQASEVFRSNRSPPVRTR
jgi:hypothetical protein